MDMRCASTAGCKVILSNAGCKVILSHGGCKVILSNAGCKVILSHGGCKVIFSWRFSSVCTCWMSMYYSGPFQVSAVTSECTPCCLYYGHALCVYGWL